MVAEGRERGDGRGGQGGIVLSGGGCVGFLLARNEDGQFRFSRSILSSVQGARPDISHSSRLPQSEHKIQSGPSPLINADAPPADSAVEDGRLTLSMDQVPKILRPLVQEWTKGGYIVSFKVCLQIIFCLSLSRAGLAADPHDPLPRSLLTARDRPRPSPPEITWRSQAVRPSARHRERSASPKVRGCVRRARLSHHG